MTQTILLWICIVLLAACLCLLLALFFRKTRNIGNADDKTLNELKAKIDSLGGASNFTNQAINNLSSMTEYRLNNMQKTLNEQLQYVSANTQRSLDEIRMTVNDKLASTLETKLNESYSVIQQRLEAVARGIGEVHSLAESLAELQKVPTHRTCSCSYVPYNNV